VGERVLTNPILSTGFTAHNIVLSDGSETKPGAPVLADTPTAQAALRIARAVCPPPARVVDLGCLEGGYAVEFARAGYTVVGIDARARNIARCTHVLQGTGLNERLSFKLDDVRNLASFGRFDVAFCRGLLYHLDNPIAFLRQLGECTTRLLILETHFAESKRNKNFWLGRVTEHEGVPGRWFREVPRTKLNHVADRNFGRWYTKPPKMDWSANNMERASRASWNNAASFWVMKRHLLKAMQTQAGFDIVCQQFDALYDIVSDTYDEDQSRAVFIGIKLATQ
jgi:SAM-dependent methyltransferase